MSRLSTECQLGTIQSESENEVTSNPVLYWNLITRLRHTNLSISVSHGKSLLLVFGVAVNSEDQLYERSHHMDIGTFTTIHLNLSPLSKFE